MEIHNTENRKPPKVSVCIDVFNYADFLYRAIESVLSQTFIDLELIVQDDCSTDDSFAIAEAYARKDGRVRAVRNPVNLGMVKNRNACLRSARGEYVKFVHADDFLFDTDALRQMVSVMESNPAICLVASAMQFVDADGKPTRSSHSFTGDCRLSGVTVITECLREQRNLIGGPSSVLFRWKQAQRGFDEGFFHAADLEMWFHLLEQGAFAYIDKPLVAYRWHTRQQTEKDRATLSQANDQRALLDRYLHKPYVRLRRWLKQYLVHESVRQSVRRGKKIGHADKVGEILQDYGTTRYYKELPRTFLLRNYYKHTRRFRKDIVPYTHGIACRDGKPVYPPGINVAGFFQGEYGIGESSRAFCRAVTETELPSVLINIASKNHRSQDRSVTQFSSQNPYRINLMTFSFDYARRFYKDRGRRFFEGRYNIALWYWELEQFPARWHPNFEYYDEIWVPTDFCQKAIASVSPIPVRKITYPFYGSDSAVRDRSQFGLRESSFVFLFSFDFFSTLARKNPLGVIEAFRQAFLPGDDVVLLLKSINSAHDPPARALIQKAIAGLNIVWLEDHLPGTAIHSLFASVDCYVSLHRSEGLGLGMAQAMYAGKPVIATGYSGNLEYMDSQNSLLVDYEITELREDYGPWGVPPFYDKGNFWAEPCTRQAAERMRWVVQHPEEAALTGERGRHGIQERLNPQITCAEMLSRIQEIEFV